MNPSPETKKVQPRRGSRCRLHPPRHQAAQLRRGEGQRGNGRCGREAHRFRPRCARGPRAESEEARALDYKKKQLNLNLNFLQIFAKPKLFTSNADHF